MVNPAPTRRWLYYRWTSCKVGSSQTKLCTNQSPFKNYNTIINNYKATTEMLKENENLYYKTLETD